MSIGIDPAPLFAVDAESEIDLVRGDARMLPFPDNSFSKAWSIDVLEHLPAEDIARYLDEAYRVLAPGGRMFVYSNTRERGPFDLLVSGSRRLADWLAKRGIIDRRRDLLRKSDHVKALETWPEVEAAAAAAGFELRRAVFWNGVFQSFIENVLLRLAERALVALRGRKGADKTAPALDEGDDAIAARSAMRGRLSRGGPMLLLLQALTGLMWLDIVLFGRFRTGPYFLLLRKPQDALPAGASRTGTGRMEPARS
jgi:SAM-dependent methyltransferase